MRESTIEAPCPEASLEAECEREEKLSQENPRLVMGFERDAQRQERELK